MAAIPLKQAIKIVQSQVTKGSSERQRWNKWTSWFLANQNTESDADAGQLGDNDGEEISLETNYPYAFLDTMAANVTPSNPQVQITHRTPDTKDAAKARSQLVNDTMRRNKLHAKLWDTGTFAGICGRGFTKTTWDDRTKRPIVRNIDPHRVFYDQSVAWDDGPRYIFEAVPLTKEEFKERVEKGLYNKEAAEKVTGTKLPAWMSDGTKSDQSSASIDVFSWIIVYEFYDLAGRKFFHLLENAEVPLFEGELPYKYVDNPFSLLVFNTNLKDSGGLSDVKRIEGAQERLNEIDTIELRFAHSAVPVPIFNESGMDDPEAAKASFLNASEPGQCATVNVDRPLSDVIMYSQTPAISPSFDTMRDRITKIIEFILGLPAYERGDTGAADVSATSHALVDTAARTRNGRRIKVMEDVFVDIAKKILGLWKQFMDPEKQVSIRDPKNGETTEMDRAALAFPTGPDATALEFEDEWYYDYDAIPYSPSEDNRLLKLQRLQQYLPLLLGNPQIDQQSLITLVAELLGMEDIKFTEPQPGGAMPPGGVPGQPGQAGSAGAAGTDPLAAGGLPNGLAGAETMIQQPSGGASLPKM